MKLEEIYNKYKKEKSDINEHLSILKYYSSKVNKVIEFGVRGGKSTIALLQGKPKEMISYDIKIWPKKGFNPLYIKELCKNNTKYKFVLADVLKIKINKTDLLFIDTYHTYNQLKQELKLHSEYVNKYIILHDTITFGYIGEDNKKPGLKKAIEEFINKNKQWKLIKEYKNNNGLTILERV